MSDAKRTTEWLELEGGKFDPSKPGVLPRWTLIRREVYDNTGQAGTGIVEGGSYTFAYLSARDPEAKRILGCLNAFEPDGRVEKLVEAARHVCEIFANDGHQCVDELEAAIDAIEDGESK